jgi:hypothetical protein
MFAADSGWLTIGSALAGVVLGATLSIVGNAWLERRRFQREEDRRVHVMSEDAARALLGWCLDAAEQASRPYSHGWPPPMGKWSEEQRAKDAESRERLRELTRLIDIRMHDLANAEVRIAVEQYSNVLHHPQTVLEWSSNDVTANTPDEVVWHAKQTIVGMLGAVIRHDPIPSADPLPQMVAAIEDYYHADDEFRRQQDTKAQDTGEDQQPDNPH